MMGRIRAATPDMYPGLRAWLRHRRDNPQARKVREGCDLGVRRIMPRFACPALVGVA